MTRACYIYTLTSRILYHTARIVTRQAWAYCPESLPKIQSRQICLINAKQPSRDIALAEETDRSSCVLCLRPVQLHSCCIHRELYKEVRYPRTLHAIHATSHVARLVYTAVDRSPTSLITALHATIDSNVRNRGQTNAHPTPTSFVYL